MLQNSGRVKVTLKGFMEEMRIELYFERKWDKDTQRESWNIWERIGTKHVNANRLSQKEDVVSDTESPKTYMFIRDKNLFPYHSFRGRKAKVREFQSTFIGRNPTLQLPQVTHAIPHLSAWWAQTILRKSYILGWEFSGSIAMVQVQLKEK